MEKVIPYIAYSIEILIVLFAIVFFIFNSIENKVVYQESFWWDTRDGLVSSKAKIIKYGSLPIYDIEFEKKSRFSPDEHPDYKKFLEKYEEIKSGRKPAF